MSRNGTPDAPAGVPRVIPIVPSLPGHQAPQETDELRSFVYNVGFLHAAWADTVLNIKNLPALHLHALFVSQSPVLYHHLSTATPQPPYHITLNVEDPYLTTQAVSTALATLYGHPIDLTNCDLATARSLLAAGVLLGLDGVARQAFTLLTQTLSPETLPQLFELALAGRSGEGSEAGAYAPYTEGLLTKLVEFVLVNLDASKPLDPAYQDVLVSLPFVTYKRIIENEKLRIATAMDRHNFAKSITRLREQHIKLQVSQGKISAPAFEEHVVLSFGGATNGVEVVQKAKKGSKSARK